MRVDIDDGHCGCWSVYSEESVYPLIDISRKGLTEMVYRKVAGRGW